MLSDDYLWKQPLWKENIPVSSNTTMSIASGQRPLIGLGYRVSMWLVCYSDVSLVFWSICTDLEEDQEPSEVRLFPSPKIRQAKQTNIQYCNTVTVPLFTCHWVFFLFSFFLFFPVIECPNNLRFRNEPKCFYVELCRIFTHPLQVEDPYICLHPSFIVQKAIAN